MLSKFDNANSKQLNPIKNDKKGEGAAKIIKKHADNIYGYYLFKGCIKIIFTTFIEDKFKNLLLTTKNVSDYPYGVKIETKNDIHANEMHDLIIAKRFLY